MSGKSKNKPRSSSLGVERTKGSVMSESSRVLKYQPHIRNSKSKSRSISNFKFGRSSSLHRILRASPRSESNIMDSLTPPNHMGVTISSSSISDQLQKRNKSFDIVHASPQTASPDDIGAKIQAMLAATEALKPFDEQTPSPTASKRVRIFPSRVLEVMLHIWDRLSYKSTETDFPSADLKRLSIKSIQIRQNEGMNINESQKARRIAGIEVRRKPVGSPPKMRLSASDARLNCVLSTPIEPSAFTVFEEVLEPFPCLPESPFDAEIGFESDVENRILSTIPEGQSTPRKSAGSPCLGEDTQLTCYPSNTTQPSGNQDCYQGTGQKRTITSELRIYPPPTNFALDDCKMFKKHPTPDKYWLERVEIGLERYTALVQNSAPDEALHELADQYLLHSYQAKFRENPSSRDNNQLMSRFSISTVDSDSALTVCSTTSSPVLAPKPNQERPCTPEAQANTRSKSCPTSPLKSNGSDADFIDGVRYPLAFHRA